MLNLILYWKQILLITLSFLLFFITLQNKELKTQLLTCKQENQKLQTINDLQNASIISQKADYETKLQQLPKEITKIQTRYQVIYKDIETITKDSNATCETSIATLDNFIF